MLFWLTAILIEFLTLTSDLAAQQQPPATPPQVPRNTPGENLVNFLSLKTPYEFWLTCLIALLGFAIIVALIWAVRRTPRARPEDISRPIIIVAVITGTLILVTAGYSNEQIAPAFGLFGTIIGYILGRMAQAPVRPGEQAPAAAESEDTGVPARRAEVAP